ncbi:MAG: HlyD family efflux transporter periplasmic adaptor subunit [Acidobacteriota bacterium]|nr:HlyD family efflux transporter periplasmic adaptor subunit [Acidobacteriota bacterium]
MTRYWRWLLIVLVVGAVVAIALWPAPVPVDVMPSTRGPLAVTVDDEGETRVRHRYVVSAPLTGRVLRSELEAGDPVVRGTTVVARVRAEAPALMDARSRAEADAAVAVARAALGRAEADLRRATAAVGLARADLRRQRDLAAAQLTTQQAVDAAETNASGAEEAVRAAEFAVAGARSQFDQATARLMAPTLEASGRILTLTAPADGVVLKRLRQSESVVAAGEPLLEIGNPAADLEIVSDLLSTDAVRVKPGAKVRVEQWGGDRVLAATVRRVEPSGFTKISALGVEEQRVNVVMDFEDPAEAWNALGDGYRVEVRIVIWEAADVVKVPTSALVRQGDAWAVFVVDGNRIRRVTVAVGQRNAEEAEIQSGLEAGAQVIVHPSDRVVAGALVEVRLSAGT